MPLQISMIQCQWEVADQFVVNDHGEKKVVGKTVVLQDPASGITVVVPLDEPVARQWAAKLEGRPAVDVATHVPGVPDSSLRNGHSGHVRPIR